MAPCRRCSRCPATDTKTLIQNGQIADIDAQVKQLPYANDFNKQVLAAGLSDDGKIYAVPAKSIYAVALHYNRKLFTDAGLDPDKPPTTWDEVRADAKTIHDKTGTPGYAMMALDNAGGWQLTAAAYSRGGRTQVLEDGKYTATLTDPAVKESLQFLGDLKKDGSLFENTQLGWGDINGDFAAGQFAMYTSGSDIYTALVQNNGVTKDNLDYGLTALPTSGKNVGHPRRRHLRGRRPEGDRRGEGRRGQVDRLLVPVQAGRPGPGRGRCQDPRGAVARRRPSAPRRCRSSARTSTTPRWAGSRTTSTSRSTT